MVDKDFDIIANELLAHGIKYRTEKAGSGHTNIYWEIGGKERRYTTSTTPSDHRSRLNCRAEVRRMLRADGIVIGKMAKSKDRDDARRGNSGTPIPDQLTDLKQEIADQTDMLLEMMDMVQFIKTALTPVEDKKEENKAELKLVERNKNKKIRIDILQFVPFDRFVSTEEIENKSMLDNAGVYNRLMYQKKKGKVEQKRGHWKQVTPKKK